MLVTIQCETCGITAEKKWRPAQEKHPRFCSKPCALTYVRTTDEWKTACQKYLRSEENPLHVNNPRRAVSQAKAQTTLRERGYQHLTGGNGTGHTVPQKLLMARLGWPAEEVVCTGLPSPYPHYYKLDIAHPTLKIDVELDGQSHSSTKRRESDARRDSFLREQGWIVLRIPNKRVLEETDKVVAAILAVVSTISKRAPETT